MPSDFPSISGLLKPKKGPASQKTAGDETAQEKFDKKMRELDIKTKEKLSGEKASSAGLPYADLTKSAISHEAIRLIPENQARSKKAVCFYNAGGEVRLGCVDYSDEVKEFAYQFGERHHANVKIYLISENSLEKVLELYADLPVVKAISKDVIITDEELAKFKEGILDFRSLPEKFKQVPVSDILTLMISAALKVDATDIHVEAEEQDIVIRYRIDGVLHDAATLPKEQWKRFVSRIKLLAALKINVTDRPQDGRVTLKLSSGSLDVRVSTMPTVQGESVVMRVLRSGSKGVTFDELGLQGKAYEALKREIQRPNGMVVTTGPTGSGKTTTMYAILRALNKPGVKIITLEDPVEIKMEGINQSQIDVSKDYTFAKGLRSILRQDPDICMVGEIRDLETAEIAIQAALTGHLMLSTIHTNSASGAIPRFLSMGVKPFLLAPSLNSIIGQRLVRKICQHCMTEEILTSEMMEKVQKALEALPPEMKKDVKDFKFYVGKGCEKCSGLGYKGRIGIYEIFTLNKEIEKLILSGQISEYDIQELAVKNGMITMVQDALLKALNKITSVEEVFRATE